MKKVILLLIVAALTIAGCKNVLALTPDDINKDVIGMPQSSINDEITKGNEEISRMSFKVPYTPSTPQVRQETGIDNTSNTDLINPDEYTCNSKATKIKDNKYFVVVTFTTYGDVDGMDGQTWEYIIDNKDKDKYIKGNDYMLTFFNMLTEDDIKDDMVIDIN